MSFDFININNEINFINFINEISKKLVREKKVQPSLAMFNILDVIYSAEAMGKKVGEYDDSCLVFCYDENNARFAINEINKYIPRKTPEDKLSYEILGNSVFITYRNITKRLTKKRFDYAMHKCLHHDKLKLIFCLLLKYTFFNGKLSGMNASCSDIYVNGSIECFGSIFNTRQRYYSMYPYIESYFSSLGNFFSSSSFLDGYIYYANPPFNIKFMSFLYKYIKKILEKYKITIVLIHPASLSSHSVLEQIKNKYPVEIYTKQHYFLSGSFSEDKMINYALTDFFVISSE